MAEIGMNPQPLRTPFQDVGNNLNAMRPGLTSQGNALQQKPAQKVSPTIIIDEKEIQRSRLALQQRTISGLNIYNPKAQQPLGAKVRMPQGTYPEAKKLEGALRTGDRDKNPSAGVPPQQIGTVNNPAEVTRRWLQMLPSCRFYFDNVEPPVVAKISKVLAAHNSSVAMFFSNDVTHLITTRAIPRKEDHARIKLQAQEESQNAAQQQASIPVLKPSIKPAGPPAPTQEPSIIVKAIGLNIKIWHMDRMKHLMEPLMGKSVAHAESRKLQDLLLHEKTYGLTTTQMDDSVRSDYHIFRGPYVLIEDTTGRHRTILAHEYDSKKTSSSVKCPWPKIQLHMTERSPFIHIEPRVPKQEAQAVPARQGIEPAAAAGEAPRVPEAQDVQPSPSALASGIVNSVTSHVVSTTSAMGKAHHAQGPEAAHDEVLRQLGKRTLPAPKADAIVSAAMVATVPTQDSKKAEFARPAEIVRPGSAGVLLEAGASKFRLQKTEQQPQAVPQTKTVIATADATVPIPLGLPPVPDPARQEQLKALAPAVPPEHRKKGYCENCRGFFEDMNRHIASQAHRIYAHDASKFVHLDKFLLRLKRQPKTVTASTKLDDLDLSKDQPAVVPSLEKSTNSDAAISPAASTAIKGDCAEAVELGNNDPCMNLLAPSSKETTGMQEPSLTIKEAVPESRSPPEGDDADIAGRNEPLESGVAQEVPLTSDNNVTIHTNETSAANDAGAAHDVETTNDADTVNNANNANDANDANDLLDADDADDLKDMATMAASVPSMTCLESQDRLLVNPFLEDASEPARVPGFFAKRVFSNQLRLPMSDNLTSQADTDATQPDDRFLDGSAAYSQATEPVVQIHLSMSMSTLTDGPEPVPAVSERERNYAHENESLGSSDSDKEESDDAVALVKSPSAGRGLFARSQGTLLRSGLMNLSSARQGDGELSRPAMSLKRKLDIALSEEREAQRNGTSLQTKTQTLKQKTVVYDDNLRSRLLSHTPAPSTRPAAWSTLRNPFESHTPMPASSPIQLLPETSPLSHQFGATAVDTTSDTLPLDSISGRDFGRPYMNSIADYGFDSQLGYPDTPSTQKVARMSAHQGTPVTLPQPFVFNSHARQFASPGADFGFAQTADAAASGPTSRQTSPTSPVGHESVLSRSPARSAYMESTSPSPSRSPSHRQMYRNHFPVMTRAEQEQERCFHHYRGHRLPEAAAQKKMRSSISLLEEFEEYGEGCMVFIE
ncbi:regulatory subunit for Cdc7p protein kinase [Entomortierella parvispora]|uniref:Regulatory subunit for Cdc7p protein kinase n=1 Tax=Entomortierella parvispora TaxID=205924 RepID=A0A9P3HB66_9FUNG|nr:regulatory subunit for Cdc7p protein kinase [Entomortierella parvispora]